MKLPYVIQVGPKRIQSRRRLHSRIAVGTHESGHNQSVDILDLPKRNAAALVRCTLPPRAQTRTAVRSDPNRRAPQGRTTHTDPRKSKKTPTSSFPKMSDNYVQIEIGRLYLDKTYELKKTRALLSTRKKRNGAAAGASVQANYDPKKCQIREEENPTSRTIY